MPVCKLCKHKKQGCDEDCHDCGQCYILTGKEICNKICQHAKHEDDGGFLIDGNHPDDMYGVTLR